MKKRNTWLAVLCFIVVLIGLRLSWLYIYNDPSMPKAEKGIIDAAKVDLSKKPMQLKGEWLFYPEQLLTPDSLSEQKKKAVQVPIPSDWKEWIQDKQKHPYGYGTFQLSILTDQNKQETYRIRFMGIQSAARIFVNGQLIKEMGNLGTNRVSSHPENSSFSVNVKPKNSKIDLMVQVSNFHYLRSGGISRPVYFGTTEAVRHHEQISMSMQLITAAVLFFHGIYLVILYMFVFKKKNLLLLATAVFCMCFSILIDDDQLLRFAIPMDIAFETRLKLAYLLYFGAVVCSFSFLKTLVPGQFNRTFRLFQLFTAIYLIALIIFPYQEFYYFRSVIYSFITLGLAFLVPVLFYKVASRKEPYTIYLVFTVVAVSSSALGGAVKQFFKGIAVPFYPFDLLIGTVCFALFWFKRFYYTAEEKTQLNAKLQRADKMKDDFLANTSHELRNPLHAMINIAQSLLSDPLSEETKRQVQMIESVARKMSYTLQDLTDISALKEGHVPLSKQPVDLYSIVEYVFDLLAFSKKGKHVVFTNDVPKTFPLVVADENRMAQVMFNLIQNALKFTEEGMISVSALEKEGQAVISVQDTGIGMDEETQKRIFQPYEQADSSMTAAGGGMGLGLSICAQLVELHGGTLFVISSPGEGSTFTFSLPISRKKRERIEEPLKQDKLPDLVAASFAREETESILVIDDDPINLSVLKRMLAQAGYAVTTCLNGEEALLHLHDQRWSLIISDVMMPRMSGYELTSQVRKKFSMSELPILLLTARGKTEDIEAGFQAGANDYILKPVEKAELMARVSALLQLKQSMHKQARTEAALLQAQMQPHFLYNTLNIIVALSEIDHDEMAKLLHEFGNYLQKSFDRGNMQETVTMESELNLVQSYLYIERQRFGERLSICWEVEDDSLQALVPPLSIQTLVENAVRHGRSEQTNPLVVSLIVKRVEDHIQVVIKDNGCGIESEKIKLILEDPEQGGIGLYNTNKRLIQLYGQGLTIQSAIGKGTKVAFSLPIPSSGNHDAHL
ncbi:ATP-binding protein [Pseudobacillus sp. 179-B 2D1 NHS]|uniref:ATP-binding protein n=1 Tax=Pseudobacillus sp. 179-B 2D1 NHS TaxID=3374292 RepID=UPI00387948B2